MNHYETIRQLNAREAEIRQAIDTFLADHHHWQDDKNGRPGHPDAQWWTAYEVLVNTIENGSIPERVQKEGLYRAISDLTDQVMIFDAADIGDMPGPDLWAALENLERKTTAFSLPQVKRRETVRELADAKVPTEQIARMYCLFLPGGTKGDAGLIARELREPGSVIGPDWVHPDDAADAADLERILAAPETLAVDHEIPEREPTTTKEIEDIWLIGREPEGTPVEIAQAAKMLYTTVAEISPTWNDLDRKEAERAAAQMPGARPIAPTPETAIAPAAKPKPPADKPKPPAAEGEFTGISTDVLTAEAKALGITIREGTKRKTIINKIKAANAKAETA